MLFTAIVNVLIIILLLKTDPTGYEREKTKAQLKDTYGQGYQLFWTTSFGIGEHNDYSIHGPDQETDKILSECYHGETFFELYYSEGTFRFVRKEDCPEEVLLRIRYPDDTLLDVREEAEKLTDQARLLVTIQDFDIEMEYTFFEEGPI